MQGYASNPALQGYASNPALQGYASNPALQGYASGCFHAYARGDLGELGVVRSARLWFYSALWATLCLPFRVPKDPWRP